MLQANLRTIGIVPTLVKLFSSNDDELCRNAIWAAGNAIATGSHMEAFVKCGGWDELQDVLRDDTKGLAHGMGRWIFNRLMIYCNFNDDTALQVSCPNNVVAPIASWCFQNKITREQSIITPIGGSQIPVFMDSRPQHPSKRQRPYYPTIGLLIEPEKDEKLTDLLNNCFRISQDYGWMRKKDKNRAASAHPPVSSVPQPTGKGNKEKQATPAAPLLNAAPVIPFVVEKDIEEPAVPWTTFLTMIRALLTNLLESYVDAPFWRKLLIWKCVCDRVTIPCEVWREAYGSGGSFVWGSEGRLELDIAAGNHFWKRDVV